jgi:hypothetical protein
VRVLAARPPIVHGMTTYAITAEGLTKRFGTTTAGVQCQASQQHAQPDAADGHVPAVVGFEP